MRARTRRLLIIFAAVAVVACDTHDSDYYPYAMTGLDSWVQDAHTLKDFYAGRVDARYWSRTDATARCADLADGLARSMQLRNWSYVCCTVTSSSSCATKIR